MSSTGRSEGQQNERDVERNLPETPNGDSEAPISEVCINIVPLPPRRCSGRNANHWTRLLAGSALTVGGVVGASYAVRNFDYFATVGLAVPVFSTLGLLGCYLAARSLRKICSCNPCNPVTGEPRNSEALRYRELLDRHLTPTLEPLPSSRTSSETESFPPSPAVSDASSDILTVDRTDYRPQSTDLSFRQKQEERAQKYKKFVQKEWVSAPTLMVQRRKSDAGKDEKENEKEKEEKESAEIKDNKEKKF